jgi:branched-chain amino acid transport system ATP-binding protein
MSLLEVDNLSIYFGGLKAVDDISFNLKEGEVFTIVGPNGAGKSTIFNLISRFYQPTTGTIRFREEDITKLQPEAIAPLGIARTFQNIELFEHSTVLQNLLVGRHCQRKSGFLANALFLPRVRAEEKSHREKIEEVIEFLDLEAYRDKMITGLPYGVRKVVELARALASGPKLLLLDEPASGLSTEETQNMAFWIEDIQKDMGVSVLMVEHDMGLVSQVSDRVLAIDHGAVLAMGTTSEVQSHPAVIEAYLGRDEAE